MRRIVAYASRLIGPSRMRNCRSTSKRTACAACRYVASPNCDSRPAGVAADLIVVHGISLPPGEFGGPWIDRLFTNTLPADVHPYFAEIAALRVSSHLCIRRDGTLDPVREVHRPRLARGTIELRRPRGLQRLLDRHRARGHGYRSPTTPCNIKHLRVPSRRSARPIRACARRVWSGTATSLRAARPIPVRRSTGRWRAA